MQYVNENYPFTTKGFHAPSANTPAVVTITAPGAHLRTVLKLLSWSYSAAPTGGKLTVTDGGSTIAEWDIIAGGPGALDNLDIPCAVNSEVVVTLAAGSGSVVGKLTVHHHAVDEIPGFKFGPGA